MSSIICLDDVISGQDCSHYQSLVLFIPVNLHNISLCNPVQIIKIYFLTLQHNAHTKAFNMYNEMQQKGFKGDVLAYNALIGAVNYIREESKERWQIIQVSQNISGIHTWTPILPGRYLGIFARPS